jgi:hypothetical protein
MGKETKQLYKTLIDLLNKQANQPKPENKPLDYITQQALAGADLLKSRDYRNLSKDGNMFFDFQLPAEQAKRREMLYNANQTGVFGMADNSGAGKATALASEFLKNKSANDDAQNFQNNIAGAAANIRGGLATAAGGVGAANDAETQRRMAIINSFSDLYKFKKSTNQAASSGLWSGIIGAGAGAASAAITKF